MRSERRLLPDSYYVSNLVEIEVGPRNADRNDPRWSKPVEWIDQNPDRPLSIGDTGHPLYPRCGKCREPMWPASTVFRNCLSCTFPKVSGESEQAYKARVSKVLSARKESK